MHTRPHEKYPPFLSEFSRQIFEKYLNFMKIRPVGLRMSHADGHADVTQSTVVFRDFGNAPKKEIQNAFLGV
jgi:hypothetical protein